MRRGFLFGDPGRGFLTTDAIARPGDLDCLDSPELGGALSSHPRRMESRPPKKGSGCGVRLLERPKLNMTNLFVKLLARSFVIIQVWCL